MIQSVFTIENNVRIARDVYRLTLRGDCSAITAPGQFVNIRIAGFFLRRPISVCNVDENGRLWLIYKVVGGGTAALSRMNAGERLDLLCGLGNGFDVTSSGDRPLLVGGGVGAPPMYMLCRKLIAAGKKPTVLLGFNTAEESFGELEFRALGAAVVMCTADGSLGVKGFVTAALANIEFDYVYACGPEPMLRALDGAIDCGGQFSFEERMGCGFGACMGCTCHTKYGAKRICKDGPVLERSEIIW